MTITLQRPDYCVYMNALYRISFCHSNAVRMWHTLNGDTTICQGLKPTNKSREELTGSKCPEEAGVCVIHNAGALYHHVCYTFNLTCRQYNTNKASNLSYCLLQCICTTTKCNLFLIRYLVYKKISIINKVNNKLKF